MSTSGLPSSSTPPASETLIPPTTPVTTSTPFFTASDPSQSPSNTGSPGAASSSLYLFTFLATLLLLLTVSCAIVIRSLIVRRRFRRRVEEALAAGIILPQQGMKRRDVGEKPKLWDSWATLGDSSWHDIMPVASKIISDKYTGSGLPRKPLLAPLRPLPADPHSQTPLRRRTGLGRFIRLRRSSQAESEDNAADPHPSSSSAPYVHSSHTLSHPSSSSSRTPTEYDDAKLQIAVMIAMPSIYRPHAWQRPASTSDNFTSAGTRAGKTVSMHSDDHEEEDLPDIAFGIAEIPWRVPSVNSGSAQAPITT